MMIKKYTKSNINVLHGLDGIKTVFNDIIATKKELVGWGATDRARKLLPEFTDDYIRQREQNNVQARQLAVEGEGILETKWSKFKFIPKEYSSPATTLIYGNKVALMMWFSKPVVSIRIHDAKITESYRNHFEFLWGTKLFSWREILASQLVQKEINDLFYGQTTEIIKRKSSHVIRLKKELAGEIQRIIILPPNGSTAGEYSGELDNHELFSPHPETLQAQVEIKGGIAPGRLGYRKIDRAIKFSYFTRRKVDLADKKTLKEEYKSSHAPTFKVVKPNGFGFWHTIRNTSNEWVLLILEKKLVAVKPLPLKQIINGLSAEQKDEINSLSAKVKKIGDQIFRENPNPLDNLASIDKRILTKALIALLNIPEHANHEPCTAVALLLKLGRENKQVVIKECQQALEQNMAPKFYLDEALDKLNK